MKKGLKMGIVIVLVIVLLALMGFGLYRHFVTNQIMDGGGGMENPYVSQELDDSETLQVEEKLSDGTEETVE